jgi:hypothetical protein
MLDLTLRFTWALWRRRKQFGGRLPIKPLLVAPASNTSHELTIGPLQVSEMQAVIGLTNVYISRFPGLQTVGTDREPNVNNDSCSR